MYYEIHGSGKPLLLLHGAFGVAAGWTALLPTLARDRQVIVAELQGHGHTPDRPGPLSFEQMADDTAELLHQIHVTTADVFGYSLGGTVALALAIQHPELVGKLAILGACCGSPRDVYEPENYKQAQSLPPDFAPPILKEPYDKTAPDPSNWPNLVGKIKALMRDFNGFPEAQVGSIQSPTLIMQGDRDGVRPEHAVEMYRLIPHAQLAILPAGDHFLLFSDPGRVLSILTPFIQADSR